LGITDKYYFFEKQNHWGLLKISSTWTKFIVPGHDHFKSQQPQLGEIKNNKYGKTN